MLQTGGEKFLTQYSYRATLQLNLVFTDLGFQNHGMVSERERLHTIFTVTMIILIMMMTSMMIMMMIIILIIQD